MKSWGNLTLFLISSLLSLLDQTELLPHSCLHNTRPVLRNRQANYGLEESLISRNKSGYDWIGWSRSQLYQAQQLKVWRRAIRKPFLWSTVYLQYWCACLLVLLALSVHFQRSDAWKNLAKIPHGSRTPAGTCFIERPQRHISLCGPCNRSIFEQ